MSKLGDNLKKLVAKGGSLSLRKREGPVWTGPGGEGPQGGVTQSLLQRFLVCRERFRLQVVEGLAEADRFNHKLEYGSMWHVCEEALASERSGAREESLWSEGLEDHCQHLMNRYPMDREAVEKWWNVCRVQFPLYVSFWQRHREAATITRTPLLQEQVFDVPYHLPSGRIVRLRGKWDSVDLVTSNKLQGPQRDKVRCSEVWLQENKTKGTIDEAQIKRQLTFDLQSMSYLVALEGSKDGDGEGKDGVRWDGISQYPIAGVRYNVVRRPLSGGKGTIVQKKGSKNVPAETSQEYYARLAQYIKDEPESYFMRWEVRVTPADVARFRRECLDPILEQMCEWWEWVSRPLVSGGTDQFNHEHGIHFRMPFGVYSPLMKGGSSEMDERLDSGSEQGLRRVENLFPELQS